MDLRGGEGIAALLVAGFAAGASAGTAPVYKCEENGAITYTDQPCSATAAAHQLPAAIVVAPPSRSELERARTHDSRLARDRAERDRADGEWLTQHAQRRDREARVRKAIVEHRVIKGMTMAEVRQALGEPDDVAGGDSFGSDKATWTYTDAAGTRVVNFKSGEVTTTRGKTAKRNKGRR